MRHLLASMHRTGRCAGLLAGLTMGWAGTAQADVLPSDPKPTCTLQQAEFAAWFQSQPGLNQPVKAADSLNLNTDTSCNFYKWSAQMFLWLTSPTSTAQPDQRVLGSKTFYQLENGNLVQQQDPAARKLSLRSAKTGDNGLPIVIDAEGRVREVVSAPQQAGLTGDSDICGVPAEVAALRSGADGTAELLDAQGQQIGSLAPKITVDMLPRTLTRIAAPAANDRVPAAADTRQQIADALTQQKVLIKVDTRNGPTFIESGTGAVVKLSPGQAGKISGVLLSQKDSIVFYEVLVNDVYAWYLTGRKTANGIAPHYNRFYTSTYGLFPTTQQDLSDIVNFAQANGGPSNFPDGNALAVEVKLSWVDASTLPDGAKGYITKQASIPTYDRSNPTIWTPNPNPETITVALVGAHVVGSTKGHPEMIWATFEHQANAPQATYSYINTSGGVSTVPSDTRGAWTFSANGAGEPYNKELACYDEGSGQIRARTEAPIGRPNVLRQKAWGVASKPPPDQQDPKFLAEATDVISLNKDLRAKLDGASAGGDPRYNYLQIGATWTLNGGEPTGSSQRDPSGNEIGTSMLSNSTMETFVQGENNTVTQASTNCFSCHGSSGKVASKPADTAVSHIFKGINALPITKQTKDQ